MDDSNILISIVEIVGAISSILYVIINRGNKEKETKTNEERTEYVKVVSKRKILCIDESKSQYFVTFEFELNKKLLELDVPLDNYEWLVEGVEGKLSFKGYKFIKFEKKVW